MAIPPRGTLRWLGQSRAGQAHLAITFDRGDAPVGKPPGHRWPVTCVSSERIERGQLLPQPPIGVILLRRSS